jgi:hypothetical protein
MGPQKLSPNYCGRSPPRWRPERGGGPVPGRFFAFFCWSSSWSLSKQRFTTNSRSRLVQNPVLLLRTINANGRADLLLSPLEVEPSAIHHIWCPSVSGSARSPVTLYWVQTTARAPRDDARLTKVTKVDPHTGNAIQVYGPPGCDLSLP